MSRKKIVYDTASELYNELLEPYFDEYDELSYAKWKHIELKYDPNNLFFETYNKDLLFENEQSTDREESVDLSDMPLLEDAEEEVRERKGKKNNS